MPLAAPKPCCASGCNVLVYDGSSRCMSHKRREATFSDAKRGTRHQRGYGSAWDVQRKQVMQRDYGICQPCKADGLLHPGIEVDHVVPKFEGGTDDESNLQTICRARHRLKTQQEAARARGLTPAADPQGGVSISGAADRRTDRLAKFLRDPVEVGGGTPAMAVDSMAVVR